MTSHLTFPRIVGASLALVVVLLAVGWLTRLDPADKPFLEIVGGGFVFNYRVADNFYGFTALVARPLESGSIIEASFDNPAGGDPLVVRERVSTMTDRYALRTPPLKGVEAHKPYQVTIRVLDREDTREIWSTTRSYSSVISDDKTPDKPLTIGPGYALNPDNQD